VVWPTILSSAGVFLLSFGLAEKEGKGIECVVDSASRGLEDRFVWKIRLYFLSVRYLGNDCNDVFLVYVWCFDYVLAIACCKVLSKFRSHDLFVH
jgi:hypothetical protein